MRLLPVLLTACAATAFAATPLPPITSAADLDTAIAATTDPAQKSALQTSRDAILAAVAGKPHVDAVIATLTAAGGAYEKTNATPDALQKAFGAPFPLFDTLRLVNLSDPKLGIKAKRDTDPFDHAFYEHLG